MQEWLRHFLEQITGRIEGPLRFRFVIQPAIAGLLALRAGMVDARQGQAPYLTNLFENSASRRHLLHAGWQDVGKVFVVAVLLDSIYQLIEFKWVYPRQLVFVALALAIVPYSLVRELANRVLHWALPAESSRTR